MSERLTPEREREIRDYVPPDRGLSPWRADAYVAELLAEIDRLRGDADRLYRAEVGWADALAEIDRLQARVAELEPALAHWKAEAEQLLALASGDFEDFDDPDDPNDVVRWLLDADGPLASRRAPDGDR